MSKPKYWNLADTVVQACVWENRSLNEAEVTDSCELRDAIVKALEQIERETWEAAAQFLEKERLLLSAIEMRHEIERMKQAGEVSNDD